MNIFLNCMEWRHNTYKCCQSFGVAPYCTFSIHSSLKNNSKFNIMFMVNEANFVYNTTPLTSTVSNSSPISSLWSFLLCVTGIEWIYNYCYKFFFLFFWLNFFLYVYITTILNGNRILAFIYSDVFCLNEKKNWISSHKQNLISQYFGSFVARVFTIVSRQLMRSCQKKFAHQYSHAGENSVYVGLCIKWL